MKKSSIFFMAVNYVLISSFCVYGQKNNISKGQETRYHQNISKVTGKKADTKLLNSQSGRKSEQIKSDTQVSYEYVKTKPTPGSGTGTNDYYRNDPVLESKSKNKFPEYINTGSEKKDIKRYTRQKIKWIKDNPQEYQKILDQSQINPSDK